MSDEECDHDWETVDDSFDHEFGTETILYRKCSKCDKESEFDYDPPFYEDNY